MKKDSILLNVDDENRGDILKALREWLADDSLIEKYEPYILSQADSLIVELFKYEGEESNIYNPDLPGQKIKKSRIFPIAKVIKAPFKITEYYNELAYREGNLLRVKNNIGIITESYQWQDWAYKKANGKNVGDIPEPPKFEGELLFWEEDRVKDDVLQDIDKDLVYLRKCGDFKLCGI